MNTNSVQREREREREGERERGRERERESRPAEELQQEARPNDSVEEEEEGGDHSIGSPQDTDDERGEDIGPIHQLPDGDGNGHREQDEHDDGQPDVPQGRVLELAAALGCGLEGDVLLGDLADERPPAGLHVGPPEQRVGHIGKVQGLDVPAMSSAGMSD